MIDRRYGTATALLLATLTSSCVARETGLEAELLTFTPPAGPVAEGGFSDLSIDPSDASGRTFLAISDRGPNSPQGDEVFFSNPAYHQKISRFRLQPDGSILRIGMDSIRDARGSWTTGLPSPFFPIVEKALPTDGAAAPPLSPDTAGFDFEGLASGDSGASWVSEEYGPRIARLERDSTGAFRIGRILSPGNGLPEVFARRAANKGLEALCRTPRGRIVAIFQGALANAVASDPGEVAERSLARRMLVLDPVAGSTAEFVAQMDDPPGKSKRRTKIGACTALDEDRILVLEHRKTKQGPPRIDLVVWDASKATDVHRKPDQAKHGRLSNGRTLEEVAMEPKGLSASGILTVSRKIEIENLAGVLPSVEGLSKPEGLALASPSEALIVFDNDFGIKDGKASSFFLRIHLPASMR